MCRKATCPTCKKATWTGCGAHVDQVLRGVAPADRCTCRERGTSSGRVTPKTAKPPKPVAAAAAPKEPAAAKPSLLRRLGLR
jgi:hypothetical protein